MDDPTVVSASTTSSTNSTVRSNSSSRPQRSTAGKRQWDDKDTGNSTVVKVVRSKTTKDTT